MAAKDPKFMKFDGTAPKVPIRQWLKLFEVLFQKLNDEKKNLKLLSYLEGSALTFFADHIVSTIGTDNWDQVKVKLITRFDPQLISPVVTAQHRRFQKSDTVRNYFDEKCELLNRVGLPDKDIADSLTDGMPQNYRMALFAARVKTPQQWLEVAAAIEGDQQRSWPSQQSNPSTKKFQSSNCTISHCDQLKSMEPPVPQRQKQSKRPSKPCQICTKRGETQYHWHSECLHRKAMADSPISTYQPSDSKPSPSTQETQVISNTSLNSSNANSLDKFIKIEVSTKGKTFNAVLDTASTCHLMDEIQAKSMGLIIDKSNKVELRMANGKCLTVGITRFPLTIKGITHEIEVHVLKNFAYTLLLGVDIGQHFDIHILLKSRKAYVNITSQLSDSTNQVDKTSDGPPPPSFKGVTSMLATPHSLVNDIYVEPQQKSKPSKGRTEMNEILKEFEDCFSKGNETGHCDLEYLIFRLKSDKPIHCRPRRLSTAKQAIVDKIVQEYLDLGIIRESTSEWAAPVTLADKKDGSHRLCIDYRPFNKNTEDDREPMPNPQDVIDGFGGDAVLSKCDVTRGYHHIPIHPDHIKFTAFVTTKGHYEFLYMPFGIKNGPAIFNRILRKALHGIKGVDQFFDDIAIHAINWTQHNRILRQVLERLRKYNIKLNRKKCQFGADEIEFLGHIISKGNLKPQPSKVRAIKDYPAPRNVKEVQRFNGLASYLRRYVPNFASIAAPITQLLRKDINFEWGEEQVNSFQAIKDALSSQPVLKIFDPSFKSELHTDASCIGIAGILFQEGHPIGYYSRRLSDAESRYTTTELELLAVVDSIEYFRIYLEGTKFTLVTDHIALKWLSDFKDKKKRQFRWSTELSTYDFDVIHRPGKQLEHVDALSRAPISLTSQQTQVVSTDHMSLVTADEVKRCQQEAALQPNGRMFTSNDGLISIETKGSTKVVIPQSNKDFIKQILKEHHEDVGHPGSNRTLIQLKKTYWWPTINKDTRAYVRSCHACQLVKPVNHPTHGPLIPLPSPAQPLDFIAMDTIVMGSSALNTSAKYIQVVIDLHSRYVWAKATKTNTAQAAISVLEPIFRTHPPPKRLLTDNGTNFRSRVFARFLRNNNVTHSYTTAYHPQCNGMNEKVNDAIARGLRLAVMDRPTHKWTTSLKKVIYDYNNTQHTVTGYKPSQLLTGHGLSDRDPPLNEVRHLATERTIKWKNNNKAKYDSKHKPLELQPNDLVKKRIPSNHPDKKKLTPKYEGPLRVIRKIFHNNYEVQYINSQRQSIVVNVSQLEPYFQRELIFNAPENEVTQ